MDPLVSLFEALRGLSRLSEPAFRRFLRGHSAALDAVHLGADTVSADDLLDRREDLPDAFLRPVVDLHQLTDMVGQKALRVVGRRYGVSVPNRGRPIEKAAGVMAHHPKVYAEAVAFRGALPNRAFSEDVGLALRQPSFNQLGLTRAQDELAEFFSEVAGDRYCQIHVWRRPAQLLFQIDYATAETYGRRYDGTTVRTNGGWPLANDLVILADGNLRIAALSTEVRDRYREVFGQLLFGARNWFRQMGIVFFDGLEKPSSVFAPTEEVDVVELKAVFGHGGGVSAVGPGNQHPLIGPGFVPGQIRELRLQIRHRSTQGIHPLVLIEPNVSGLGGWTDDGVGRKFLTDRRLLRLPLLEASPPTAETYLLVRPHL
ncbi:MAG: hypothetical protein ABMB14_06825 [Myxococcota bacterium]